MLLRYLIALYFGLIIEPAVSACTPGSYYKLDDRRWLCFLCEPGTYQLYSEQRFCYRCLPGSYSQSGATSCTPCEPGTYQSSWQQPSCSPCDIGYFQPFNGTSACYLCGSYLTTIRVGSKFQSDCITVTLRVSIDIEKSLSRPVESDVTITCSVSGSGFITVYWLGPSGNTLINSRKYAVTPYNVDTGKSSLTIYSLSMNDNGTYTCEATNGSASRAHDSIQLTPYVTLRVSIDNEKSLSRPVDSDVILTCSVSGSGFITVYWFGPSGNTLTSSTKYGVTSYNVNTGKSSLTIYSLSMNDNGIYTCEATDGSPSRAQDSIQLMPYVTLRVSIDNEKSLSRPVDSDVILTCSVSGSGFITVYWFGPSGNTLTSSTKYGVTSYNVNTGKSSLTIYSLSMNDNGIYTCEATDGSPSRAQDSIQLMPYVTLRVSIDNEKSLSRPVDSDVILTCSVSGSGFITVYWFGPSGNTLTSSTKYGVTSYNVNTGKSSLTIYSLSMNDNGIYTCEATDGSPSRAQDSIQLMPYVTLRVSIDNEKSLSRPVDSDVILTCSVSGSGFITVYWFGPSGNTLTSSTKYGVTSYNVNTGKSSLTIYSLSMNDNGIYTCEATDGSPSRAQDSIQLMPYVSIDNEKSLSRPVDSDVTLTCSVSGSGFIIVYWFGPSGNTLINSTKYGVTSYNVDTGKSSLTIYSLSMNDNRTYTCQGTDGSASMTQDFIQLMPCAKLRVFIDNEKSLSRPVDSDVTLTCSVSGSGFITVYWLGPSGNALINSTKYAVTSYNVNTGKSSLTIYSLSLNDNGIYTCRATDESASRVQDSIQLKPYVTLRVFIDNEKSLSRPVDSDVTITCSVSGSGFITISWFGPSGNTLINSTKYGVTSYNVDTGKSSLTIYSLSMNDNGTYTCQATNGSASRAQDSIQLTPYGNTARIGAESEGNNTNIGVIAGGAGGAIAFLLVVAIVIFITLRQYRLKEANSHETSRQDNSLTPPNNSHLEISIQQQKGEVIYTNLVREEESKEKCKIAAPVEYASNDNTYYNMEENGLLPSGVVMLSNLWDYVQEKTIDGSKLSEEFEALPSGLLSPAKAAIKAGNYQKNRYKGLYPSSARASKHTIVRTLEISCHRTKLVALPVITKDDSTRVQLLPLGEDKSDYINASFIDGYSRPKAYIASQGTTKFNINDFWRMIYQQDVQKIVMLTRLVEDDTMKCLQYWPDEGSQQQYGGIKVTLVHVDTFAEYDIRTLAMTVENTTKQVTQFHFTAWPDKGVPEAASSIVQFWHKVRNLQSHSLSPTVVHCSAGIGRTGTYIALDYLVDQGKDKQYVHIFSCVAQLRRQRVNLVQTEAQYRFLHEALAEALMVSGSAVSAEKFPAVYKELLEIDRKQRKTGLLLEFEKLQNESNRAIYLLQEDNDTDGEEEENEIKKESSTHNPQRTSKLEVNKHKNRYSNVLPSDAFRPYLSLVEGRTDYINAVKLPSHRQKDGLFVTQMPMEDTVIDFWRLVYDFGVRTIVMLNVLPTNNKGVGVYWPSKGESLTELFFNIENVDESRENKDYLWRTIRLTKDSEQPREVRQFQCKFWPEPENVPLQTDAMLKLIDGVEQWQRQAEIKTVVVHCMDGAERSGLYCVLTTVLERLNVERDVAIYQTVKKMRTRRQQIIPKFEQYKYCHDVVLEYLNNFGTYSNFS